MKLSFFSARIEAGFPSPADDHLEGDLDLNKLLIQNGPATFFLRARETGPQGKESTIQDGDLLIVDKSRKAQSGDLVVAWLDGQFAIRRLRVAGGTMWLLAENKSFREIQIEQEQELVIWGVVTARISQFH
jgi:DNA polymerase V